jgi:hypothetical protein
MKPSKTVRYVFWLGSSAYTTILCGCLLQLNPGTDLTPSPYFQSCDLEALIDASMPKMDAEIIWHAKEGSRPSSNRGQGIGFVNTSRCFKGCFSFVSGAKAVPVDSGQSDRLMRGLHQRLEEGLRTSGMHFTSMMHYAQMPGAPGDRRLVGFEISFDRMDKGQNLQHIGQVKATLGPSKVPEGAQELTVALTEDARPIVH